MSELNAFVGINFSLLGTKLRAAYQKEAADGYAVLLIPSEQEADNGVNIGQVIEDIKKLVSGVNSDADTSKMEDDLKSGVGALATDGNEGKFDLNSIVVKLQMAYLYISKKADKSELEYAFKLDIITDGLIPKEIQGLVDVENLSIAVWSTNRKKVLDKMALVTIGEYIGEKNE